jgi:hypothetical protein
VIHLATIMLAQAMPITHDELIEVMNGAKVTVYAALGIAATLMASWKIIERFLPERRGRKQQGDVCPLGADPELKALLAQQLAATTTLTVATAKMQADHEIHKDRLDDIRRSLDRMTP